MDGRICPQTRMSRPLVRHGHLDDVLLRIRDPPARQLPHGALPCLLHSHVPRRGGGGAQLAAVVGDIFARGFSDRYVPDKRSGLPKINDFCIFDRVMQMRKG